MPKPIARKPFTLPEADYAWALKHLIAEGDTDILPRLPEIEAIKYCWGELKNQLSSLDLNNYEWTGGRRFLVPKERFAFRVAIQLEPLDSIILAAIIKKYGKKIEKRRVPESESRVFSYRFNPSREGRFYSDPESWHSFWKVSLEKAKKLHDGWIAILDITDYYNQIYHHVLENQLVAAGIPEEAKRLLMRLIKSHSHAVSRGVPVGPHAIHILAECALIPTDQSLLAHRLDFCRYVDDIHVFCSSEQEAEIAIHDIANILDAQQKLTLQRQKTRVLPAAEFIELAERMHADNPINQEETNFLNLIRIYSSNPYVLFSIKSLSAAEREVVAPEKLQKILDAYLAEEPVNYIRVRWLLRRLAQCGAPGAIEYTLKEIERLTPTLGDVARYILITSDDFNGSWRDAGKHVVTALGHPLIGHSEYMQVILINLFAKVAELNHIDSLTARYATASPIIRREIVLAAGAAEHGPWIRERKDDFAAADPWFRRALISAATSLPGDEAPHWIKSIKRRISPMEKVMARWAFRDKKDTLRLGQINV